MTINQILANKLLINFDKTNYVIFKTRNKRIDESAIHISVDGKEIKKCNSVKFLGIYIDCDLTWKNHINYISCKISRVIGVINRLKHLLPIRVLVNLYNTMILPDLNYCIILWGGCASYLFNKVFVLQKKVVRITTNSSYNAHTDKLFVKLNILKLEHIYELSVTSFMFLYMKNALPSCFNNYFVSNKTINTYTTRNSEKIYIPTTKYNFSRTIIRYKGPVMWNNLSESLKNSPSLSSLKRNFKMKYLNPLK